MQKNYLYTKISIIFIILSLSINNLCACANPSDSTVITPIETMPEPNIDKEIAPSSATEASHEELTHYLKDIDWEAFQAQLPKEEAETLLKYLPVLSGDEFMRINRNSYYSDFHELQQTVIQDIIDEVEPQEILVESILFADVFQCGTKDIILQLQNIGGLWLILHEENDVIYGIDMPIRWFLDLQENGLYCSSGGAGSQTYYRMTFSNGDFTEHIICKMDDGEFYIDGEKQGTTPEEAWELYDAWQDENTQNPVKEYNPFKTH